MIFVKFSPKRAHLYFFRYLGGWGAYGTRVATWHFTEMINYIGIYTQILEVWFPIFSCVSHFQLYARGSPTPRNIVFMIFIKFSHERARLYIFDIWGGVGWSWYSQRNLTFYRNDQLHSDFHPNSESIFQKLFVRACDVHERSSCELNHSGTFKTKNKSLAHPPPVFAKTFKT